MSDKEVKPGYKSSEFWLSTVASVIGLLMASGALDGSDNWVTKVIGAAITILTALGYNVGRAKIKSKE